MEKIPLSKSYIVAVTGGSCSGKTTLVKHLHAELGSDHCAVMFQDSYYLGLSSITNYDHLDAIDFGLMRDHLALLRDGISVDMPCYDFATHKRLPQSVHLDSKPIILVDGILVLASQELRNSFDLKVFAECEEEVRRERRIKRDVAERGRQYEETLHQFDTQVVPAHNLFVEPSKQYADYTFAQEDSSEATDKILSILQHQCEKIIAC